jgi:hypothetical protein
VDRGDDLLDAAAVEVAGGFEDLLGGQVALHPEIRPRSTCSAGRLPPKRITAPMLS